MAEEKSLPDGGGSSGRRQPGRLATDSRAFRSIQSTLNQPQRTTDRRSQLPHRIASGDGASGSTTSDNNKSGIGGSSSNAADADDISERVGQLSVKESVSIEDVEEQLDLMVSSSDGPSSSRIVRLCVTCGRGIDQGDFDEWCSFVDRCVVASALQHGHVFIDLAVEISLALIGCYGARLANLNISITADIATFQNAMEFVILQQMSQLMTQASESAEAQARRQSLCELMAKLLVANWPRQYTRCMRERNAVLFAVMNLVKGWIIELKKQMDAPNERMTATCNACAEFLLHLCQVVGRRLWLKWPELVDEIYVVIKPLIVSDDMVAKRSTRLLLLDLFVQINEWPKSGPRGGNSTPR